MGTPAPAKTQVAAPAAKAPAAAVRGLLQRTCACGTHTFGGGECDDCRRRGGEPLRRAANGRAPGDGDVPPIVYDTLRSPGRPLDASARDFFEPRFAHDFSGVRAHTDERAAQSARAVGALAYTLGNHIVFGEGQYAPETPVGLRLFAHELAHVTQHDAPQGIIRRAVAPAAAATDGGGKVASIIETLHLQTEVYVSQLLSDTPGLGNDPLDVQLKALLDNLLKGLGIINSELGGDAKLTQELRKAYVEAVQAAVALGGKVLKQTTHGVYEKHRDAIHEWAWPQASADPGAGELSDALPEDERQRLQVLTPGGEINLRKFFDLGGMALPLPQGVTARYASTIPPKLKVGLTNFASKLVRKSMDLNSTITMALDLEPYGGDYAAFRFTYLEHQSTEDGAATREVLIERLGSLGLEGLPPSQQSSALKKFEAHGFVRGKGWDDEEFERLLETIAQIPDTLLSLVDGLTFEQEAELPSDNPDKVVMASYNLFNHTVAVYDQAFSQAMIRFGLPGSGVSSELTQVLMHEMGHAVDLAPLRQVWESSSPFEQKEKEMAAARSASGARFEKNPAKTSYRTDESGTQTETEGSEFRVAANKDGGNRITEYSEEAWKEYFAEAYSLYLADPATMKRLRPHVFEYFSKKYPKEAAPKGEQKPQQKKLKKPAPLGGKL